MNPGRPSCMAIRVSHCEKCALLSVASRRAGNEHTRRERSERAKLTIRIKYDREPLKRAAGGLLGFLTFRFWVPRVPLGRQDDESERDREWSQNPQDRNESGARTSPVLACQHSPGLCCGFFWESLCCNDSWTKP